MSVRKRTWTNARGEPKEAWIVDYTDQGGKRRLKTFKRKKEADAYHARVNVEVAAGIHTPDSASITVRDATTRWLASCRAAGLEPSTIASYEQAVTHHILPFLGRVRLSQLSAPGVREFEDRLRAGGRSPSTIKKTLSFLGAIIGEAVERGLVAQNVAVRFRRKRGTQAERRAKGKLLVGRDIPAPDEIKALVGALQGRWRPILLAAIFTGLRSSELRGLRWGDVDLDKRELHVRQRADRYNVMGRPKSEAGERAVPFPRIVANALREWKLACFGELVFPTGSGTIERHANIVARGLIPAWNAAGVVDATGRAKYTGLHSLRHFYASWCINRKADGGLELPLKTVQSRLGHSTLAMTADTYGHLFPRGDDLEELDAAEKSLLG